MPRQAATIAVVSPGGLRLSMRPSPLQNPDQLVPAAFKPGREPLAGCWYIARWIVLNGDHAIPAQFIWRYGDCFRAATRAVAINLFVAGLAGPMRRPAKFLPESPLAQVDRRRLALQPAADFGRVQPERAFIESDFEHGVAPRRRRTEQRR